MKPIQGTATVFCLMLMASSVMGQQNSQKTNSLATPVSSGSALAGTEVNLNDDLHLWTCSNGEKFHTKGIFTKIAMILKSKSYDMQKEMSLPGSLRYKNQEHGYDLVVLGSKAMLFNVKTGSRVADDCKTAAMKEGKESHLIQQADSMIKN
ncbi:MAG: hypothetical protein JHC80_00475 [Polynucleobacter sp.]|nr:hypothetical protein [Polynucleobacter sp.]